MKKGLFTGWKEVFSFTFMQSANAKYKKLTIILGLLLTLAGASVSIIMAFVQKSDDTYASPIETVYIVDDSNLKALFLEAFEESKETFPNVTFVMTERSVEAATRKISQSDSQDVILHVKETIKDGETFYRADILIPENSAVSQSDGEKLGDALMLSLRQSILLSSDIPMEKLAVALSGVNVSLITAGDEERSLGEELVQMLVPMILMLFTYMMVLIYGMSIGNEVSVEKSSKLMEMILTLTKPYGLILGKVLALSLSAIIQIVSWLGGFVIGFFAGDFIADRFIYPGYVNYILEVFNLLNGKNGVSAFSAPSAILGLLMLILGLILFFSLAAMIASFASKAEDVPTMMSYYQIILVGSFMASYLLPLREKEWINIVLRLVPVTAAYKLPGDIVAGNIPLWQGFAYGALLFAFVLVLSLLAGIIYKNEIFNKGKSTLDRIF